MAAATITSKKRRIKWGPMAVDVTLALLILIWLIPVAGLLISSFRPRFDIQTSGWWTVFPHQDWVTTETFQPPADLDTSGVMTIRGATGTFEHFRDGVVTPDGERLIWIGNKRNGTIHVQTQQWVYGANWTLQNYEEVLGGQSFQIRQPDGTVITEQ